MNDYRARTQDLCMGEPSPFQQKWEYRTVYPLEDVINSRFFLPVRDTLRAGDSITLCRFDTNDFNSREAKLLEVADVRVVCSGRAHDVVELHVRGEIEKVGGEPKRGPGRPPKMQAA